MVSKPKGSKCAGFLENYAALEYSPTDLCYKKYGPFLQIIKSGHTYTFQILPYSVFEISCLSTISVFKIYS